MRGTMLWFNLDKGFGYIRTEEDERLYVARDGFLPDHQPPPRCRGREVVFERRVGEGEASAIDVSFVAPTSQRRARLRHARGGRSL